MAYTADIVLAEDTVVNGAPDYAKPSLFVLGLLSALMAIMFIGF